MATPKTFLEFVIESVPEYVNRLQAEYAAYLENQKLLAKMGRTLPPPEIRKQFKKPLTNRAYNMRARRDAKANVEVLSSNLDQYQLRTAPGAQRSFKASAKKS